MANTTPNKKNMRERADYGVRVARPGYDAAYCEQNQLLFNSGWPILQITKVMKVDDMEASYLFELTTTVTIIDTSGGYPVPISTTTTVEEVQEAPAGYTSTATGAYTPSDEYRSTSVNRIYVRKLVSGTQTIYIYPNESHTEGDITTITERQCQKLPTKSARHRLGYTPFFMDSGDISNITGYVVFFSVDIATDVDYPYTESALSLYSPVKDYGIKSSSIFGKNVPGLCTNMFSKLVQAVKTQATSEGVDEKRAIWSPVKAAAEAKSGELLPYEFYAFLGNASTDTGIDGGVYYAREYPFFLTKNSTGVINDGWAVAVGSYQTTIDVKNSLVVLRSPMVSPEYEERTV